MTPASPSEEAASAPSSRHDAGRGRGRSSRTSTRCSPTPSGSGTSTSSSRSGRRPTSRTTASGWRPRCRRPRARQGGAGGGADRRDRQPRAGAGAAGDRARRARRSRDEPLAQGFLLTYRELCAALGRAGVESFDPAGEPFDPNRHEALQKVPVEGAEPGTVVETMQKGYRLGEQLIRARPGSW